MSTISQYSIISTDSSQIIPARYGETAGVAIAVDTGFTVSIETAFSPFFESGVNLFFADRLTVVPFFGDVAESD